MMDSVEPKPRCGSLSLDMVRFLRKARKLSYERIALQAGVSHPTVSRFCARNGIEQPVCRPEEARICTEEVKKKIIEYGKQRLLIREIVEIVGIKRSYVAKILLDAGQRRYQEKRRKYRVGKLSLAKVLQMREEGQPYSAIAKLAGVCPSAVRAAVKREERSE